MPMSWRQFTLLCTLVISFFVYLLQPVKSEEENRITFEVDDKIAIGGGITYLVAPLPVDENNQALPTVTRQKYRCGKYFFVVHYGDKEYVGFYLFIPAEDSKPPQRLIMLFPKDSYMVVPSHHAIPASPEVEFNNSTVIIHINQPDFNQLTCLVNHVVI